MDERRERRRGGKRLRREPRARGQIGARLAALGLCLALLTAALSGLATAAGDGGLLREKVAFTGVSLYRAGANGQAEGEPLSDGVLLKQGEDEGLVLRYDYTISEEQCDDIAANTAYFLEVSPHLVLPNLPGGSPLELTTADGNKVEFGRIYADGQRAWVIFTEATGGGTVLSQYGELRDAYFYLGCTRAEDPPAGEDSLEGHKNLYALKFESGELLRFGYYEDQPVSAKAVIQKQGGTPRDRIIPWNVSYTPWQNPADKDPVDLNTPCELRDTINTALHSYVDGSAEIDGAAVPAYTSRDDIPERAETYLLVETAEGKTTLTFGGMRFRAGEATRGSPARALRITYETAVEKTLLLPGATGDNRITNAAGLFAGPEDATGVGVSGSATVTVSQPTWVTKEGHTERHTDGTGSTTTWTVTFQPNGFPLGADGALTLHDQLPQGSTRVRGTVEVDGTAVAEPTEDDGAPGIVTDKGNGLFSVGPLTTDGTRPVTITYRTHVPEEMYDSSTSLGSNVAWFTFQYGDQRYTTPQVKEDVGNGDGTGTPGTAVLVKESKGYDPATRTIHWLVTINPHQAYVRSGTFTDDLRTGGPAACGVAGHTSGLELVGGPEDIEVQLGGVPYTGNLVTPAYSDDRRITVTVGEIGIQKVTLAYDTKVCDPCIFAGNTAKAAFQNTIKTDNLLVGRGDAVPARSTQADDTETVNVQILRKLPPVYDYARGTMKWTVELNAPKLRLTDVELTDQLPEGLTYVENSLGTVPAVDGASALAAGQLLTIRLDAVEEFTRVTFETAVKPEILGFGDQESVTVGNTVHMAGKADGLPFEVSHRVERRFTNHGLVKRDSTVENTLEFIGYEVLINPYHVALPENPSLVDTLDRRLQLDVDTLRLYPAELSGTTEAAGQRPGYKKTGEGQPLEVSNLDPDSNRFTVELPLPAGDRGAYVLTYTADIIDHQAGGYGNHIQFAGQSTLLGGGKGNTVNLGSAGAGGGGGVAGRKATVSIVKTDSETQEPLPGVTFRLYRWVDGARGLPVAQGVTDARGELSLRVNPGGTYVLVEEQGLSGYGTAFQVKNAPEGVTPTQSGLLLTAGTAGSKLALALTNQAHTADIVFRLVSGDNVPLPEFPVQVYDQDPTAVPNPVPVGEVKAGVDGTVRIPGVRRGATRYLALPGGGIVTVAVPPAEGEPPRVTLPNGSWKPLTEDFGLTGTLEPERQWTLTVHKVVQGTGEPLAGAAIALYADQDCQTLVQTGVSDSDGTVLFRGLLRGQRYWVAETDAPSGYTRDSAAYEAGEEDPDVTVANAPVARPVNPGSSGGSGGSGSHVRPGAPGSSGDPTAPGSAGGTGGTGEPSAGTVPGGTGGTGEPGTGTTPGGAGETGEPGVETTPGGAGETGEPGAGTTPGGASGSGQSSAGGGSAYADIPKTGDSAAALSDTTAVLTLLAAGYLFTAGRRRRR